MKPKQIRRSGNKNTASRWYALFVLVGLLAMLLWPTAAAAIPVSLPLTDAQELKQAWEYAATVGVYRYQTNVLQTTHPTLRLNNAGRGSKTDRITVAGLMDRPNDTMLMQIQGKSDIELKVEEGISYGRTNSQDEWTRVENQSDFFALVHSSCEFVRP